MPRERIRAHVYPTVIHTGRGIPPLYNHLINTPHGSEDEEEETELNPQWEFLKTIPEQWKDERNIKAFKVFSEEVLGLEEYNVSSGREAGLSLDPDHDDEGVQIGAVDKYVQGIVLHRNIIAEECLSLRKNWDLMSDQAARMKSSISRLCRNIYFGNANAAKEGENCIPMLVWILNRPKLPHDINMLTIKGLSEVLHTSPRLKKKFAETKGAKLLIHCIREMPRDPEIACWAAYCLAMASVNCPELVAQAKTDVRFLDLVSEICFDIYWYNWPVNYGAILKSIYCGPVHHVHKEYFQFL